MLKYFFIYWRLFIVAITAATSTFVFIILFNSILQEKIAHKENINTNTVDLIELTPLNAHKSLVQSSTQNKNLEKNTQIIDHNISRISVLNQESEDTSLCLSVDTLSQINTAREGKYLSYQEKYFFPAELTDYVMPFVLRFLKIGKSSLFTNMIAFDIHFGIFISEQMHAGMLTGIDLITKVLHQLNFVFSIDFILLMGQIRPIIALGAEWRFSPNFYLQVTGGLLWKTNDAMNIQDLKDKRLEPRSKNLVILEQLSKNPPLEVFQGLLTDFFNMKKTPNTSKEYQEDVINSRMASGVMLQADTRKQFYINYSIQLIFHI